MEKKITKPKKEKIQLLQLHTIQNTYGTLLSVFRAKITEHSRYGLQLVCARKNNLVATNGSALIIINSKEYESIGDGLYDIYDNSRLVPYRENLPFPKYEDIVNKIVNEKEYEWIGEFSTDLTLLSLLIKHQIYLNLYLFSRQLKVMINGSSIWQLHRRKDKNPIAPVLFTNSIPDNLNVNEKQIHNVKIILSVYQL